MVGDRIKEARVQHLAMTQRELATALQIESVNVSRWERGVAEPRLPHLRRIAEMSGLPVSWFFEETGVVA
jgi:transcriptional regulator with XRE-family HTH domain